MNILDFLKKAKRGPQIILPKDAGAIIAETGCAPGWKVVDAGTGSGFLALFLANLGCKVYTYEKEKRFYEIAKENIKKSGLDIKIFNKDITKGIKEKKLDLITLDMKNPEKVIKYVYKSLKPKGFAVIYSMHIEEVKNVVKELEKYKFGNIRIIETFLTEWQTVKNYTRPKTWMLGHTGFLTFARKLL